MDLICPTRKMSQFLQLFAALTSYLKKKTNDLFSSIWEKENY